MDFVEGLPLTRRGHNSIWVIVDRLTKSGHFIPTRKDLSVAELGRKYVDCIVRYHGTPSELCQIEELSLLPVCGGVCNVHLALSRR